MCDRIGRVNPSTAFATVLVDELVRHGVRHAVLCPGSRSAPLAFAMAGAAAEGRLELHVRTDERSAGFVALGLAAGGVPVPVVTTSGTAVANLHPAVLEASHAGVPLLVLTADRPPELRGTGANQTTEQVGIFGSAVRWAHDLGTPDERAGSVASWRSTTARVIAAALGVTTGWPGPVHLNLPLREPLVPDGDPTFAEALDGRPGGLPWTRLAPSPGGHPPDNDMPSFSGPALSDVPRTLVVVGDLPGPAAVWGARAAELARRRGWPLVAEPSGGAARGTAVPHGPLLLTCADWLARHRPDRVLVVGRVTLARPVAALLRDPRVDVELVTPPGPWPDPAGRARAVHPLSVLDAAESTEPGVDPSWLPSWQDAGTRLERAVRPLLDGAWPSGLAVADVLTTTVPEGATLFVGSSNAVRDLDLASAAPRATVVANRGLAGIDGCISTAVGRALATGAPTYALVGDLTFAHDAAALAIGPYERRPDLTVVVVNDDGGGIFGLLEPGEPRHAAVFDRVFGTPLGLDLEALCAATRTPWSRADGRADLVKQLAEPPSGLRVVEVRVERSGHRDLHARLRQVAAAALG
jgi:2-succinyl-5-enolpyruvyl-6-hydroxy-3-cyclohexene-1-carboxylate synthase